MSHHVGVGEVHHDQVVPPFDGGDQLVAHFGRGHFGLQVIGGDLGRFRHEAVFAGEGVFAPAVQEEGDMGVFLRLGQTELPCAATHSPSVLTMDRFGKAVAR